jgi:hypothetical protein
MTTLLVIAAAWTVLSVPAALLVGRWLAGPRTPS